MLSRIRHAHKAYSSNSARLASTRSATYTRLSQEDVQAFRSMLGGEGVVIGSDDLEGHNVDWMKRYRGQSELALLPGTTEEVSRILKYCSSRRLAVVPQAGKSGLCGGGVPVHDEIILLTRRLNKVRSFDAVGGILTCQAGCTLGALNEYVADRGYTIPLDLGAKECQAGGFVSTNAGGLRLLRYGSLRGTVLGVEAVLADGAVLDLLAPLRKDNTGLDLKQLFIGGEGSLGVVTAVSLLCPPKPRAVHVCWLVCPSFEAIQELLICAKGRLGEILSAFEFIDDAALEFTLRELHDELERPESKSSAPFYVLIETAGSNAEHDFAKLQDFLAHVSSSGFVLSSTVAKDARQISELWQLRQSISIALSRKGSVYKYDLSLPVADIYGLVQAVRNRVKQFPDTEVVAYGHLGDGNIHLNISVPQYDEAIMKQIEPFVYDYTAAHSGSISAEHGLGQMKNDCMRYSKPDNAIRLMEQVKDMFDPLHILNPYKFLPSAYWARVGQAE